MADQTDDLRAQLKEIDDTLAQLRGETKGPDGSPVDPASLDPSDRAQDLTGYEEDRALIETLEQRRADLVARLDG